MPNADEYRQQAAEQTQAAQVHLAALDPERHQDKVLLGILGALKATLFTGIADILETVDSATITTPGDLRANRNHRLRMAAIRGDQAGVDAIMQEVENELRSKLGTTGESEDS